MRERNKRKEMRTREWKWDEKWRASLTVTHQVIIHKTLPVNHYTPPCSTFSPSVCVCLCVCVSPEEGLLMEQFCTLAILSLWQCVTEHCPLSHRCLFAWNGTRSQVLTFSGVCVKITVWCVRLSVSLVHDPRSHRWFSTVSPPL